MKLSVLFIFDEGFMHELLAISLGIAIGAVLVVVLSGNNQTFNFI